nr:MAG TPA: hypothetical protein [Caudoviricetes sp.]
MRAVFGQFICPIFYYHKSRKTGGHMYERLIACGFTPQMANDVLALYQTEGGLQTYVFMIEHIYREFRHV